MALLSYPWDFFGLVYLCIVHLLAGVFVFADGITIIIIIVFDSCSYFFFLYLIAFATAWLYFIWHEICIFSFSCQINGPHFLFVAFSPISNKTPENPSQSFPFSIYISICNPHIKRGHGRTSPKFLRPAFRLHKSNNMVQNWDYQHAHAHDYYLSTMRFFALSLVIESCAHASEILLCLLDRNELWKKTE